MAETRLFRDFFWQRASFEQSDHSEIDEFHFALGLPEQKDAAGRLHGQVVAMGNANLSAIGQMQGEWVRLG